MTDKTEEFYTGALYLRDLPDGRIIVVYPMLYTYRVCIGPQDSPFIDSSWDYPSQLEATIAAEEWDGEGDPPIGWHRHVNSGRRRPEGDPAQEYVNP